MTMVPYAGARAPRTRGQKTFPLPAALPVMPRQMRGIFLEVCERHKVPPLHVVSASRDAALVVARRDFVVQCRAVGYSYPKIGMALLRNHVTALYHYRLYLKGATLEPVHKAVT